MMGMLDDPAFNLRRSDRPATMPAGARMRFRPSSTFVRDFGVPHGATGILTNTYEHDGRTYLGLAIEGFGHATGVRADEMQPA